MREQLISEDAAGPTRYRNSSSGGAFAGPVAADERRSRRIIVNDENAR